MEVRCDALLCDIDGTLVDSGPAIERSWRSWAREYRLDADDVLAHIHGRRSEDTVAAVLPASVDQARAVRRIEELELADLDAVAALPGARDLLAALPAGRWAAVTSGGRDLMSARLRAAGLPEPDVLVAAEDVRDGKPDPGGYLLAARRLGVRADGCVVVEDSPAGVAAGRAAGARVVAVTTTHAAADLAGAHVVVPDLARLAVRAGDGRVTLAVDRPGSVGTSP